MFSLEVLRKLAKLSKINLTESEENKLVGMLEKTKIYMDMLNQLDTTNVLPTYQTSGVLNRFQEKDLTQTLEQNQVLRNATNNKNGLIVAQAVFDRK